MREEQTRPFVLIDFHAFSTIIEIRVTNIGATLARDVSFQFTPPLTSARDDDINRKVADLNIFKNGILSLAPRKEIKLFFDQFPVRIEQGLPLTYEVEVSYSDQHGTRYTDSTVIDLTMYLGTGAITQNGLHEVHKELKSLADSLKKWTDWSGGVKVVTREDIDRRNAEFEREFAEERIAEPEFGDESPGQHG